MNPEKISLPEPVLLPCPFCGGEAKHLRNHKVHEVTCTQCGAWSSWDEWESAEDAAAAWNRRHTAAHLSAAVEADRKGREVPERTDDAYLGGRDEG